ncbi:hypothetical protein J6590_026671 [Homalodisca vitripennis]|nr:hypothetical protein J6590_026671 [Homalodisca vitripennis]
MLGTRSKCASTPCPDVRHGDEWGEPGNCAAGDLCGYCHTRTEQQFHPEIYKSTKCNDVQQAGYCPRGVFCAFAHVDQEMSIARELAAPLDAGTNLADILSNVLPKRDQKSSESSMVIISSTNSSVMNTPAFILQEEWSICHYRRSTGTSNAPTYLQHRCDPVAVVYNCH